LSVVQAVPQVFRPTRELRAERSAMTRHSVIGFCLLLSFVVMLGDQTGFLNQLMPNRKVLLKVVVVPCAILALVLTDRGRLARSRLQIRLLFLLGLMGASLAWTWNPHDTMFSLQAFVLPMLVMITVLGAYDRDAVMRVLPKAATVMIAFQFLDSLLVPSTHGGYLDSAETLFQEGWHGSFQHKNIFGVTLAGCICILLALEPRAKVRRVAIPAAVFLVVASRSGTAMSTLLVPALLPLIRNAVRARNRRERSARVAVMAFGLSFGVALAYLAVDPILNALGKDRSLTGRTAIWKASIRAIVERPLLGYGWGGVFTGNDLEPTYTIQRRTKFLTPHAHNAVLNLWLQLGIVGVILMSIIIVGLLRYGIRRILAGDINEGFLFFSLPLVLLIAGVSENTFSGIGAVWCALLVPLANHQDQKTAPSHRRVSYRRRSREHRPTPRELVNA
jgi:exopolysaccharide production protein ExoQ